MRAGRGQQDFGNSEFTLQNFVAAARKGSISGGVPVGNGLGHVLVLLAGKAGTIERDRVRRHERLRPAALRTTSGGFGILRACMRARYAAMNPSAASCPPR